MGGYNNLIYFKTTIKNGLSRNKTPIPNRIKILKMYTKSSSFDQLMIKRHVQLKLIEQSIKRNFAQYTFPQ